jgi:hypothetical protein
MYTMKSVVLGMYFLHIFSGTVPKSQRVASARWTAPDLQLCVEVYITYDN